MRANIRMLALVATMTLCGAGTMCGQASATNQLLEERTRALASQLRCPVCQGESIENSPAELAREMKDIVREQLAAGQTDDQVKAYFVGRYGDWILLEPPPRGFNLVLYALPWLGLAVAGGLLFIVVRRWARTGAQAPQPPTATPATGALHKRSFPDKTSGIALPRPASLDTTFDSPPDRGK